MIKGPKNPVLNFDVKRDELDENIANVTYDLNMKLIKQMSESVDVEIIKLLTVEQLIQNSHVKKLLEASKPLADVEIMHEEKENYRKVLAEWEGEND